VIGSEIARELITAFLQAKFSREDRHVRRVEKINALEN
jgi:ribose 5-phosphate isomerase RpiB